MQVAAVLVEELRLPGVGKTMYWELNRKDS